MPWPIFPACPAFGFTSMPDYSVSIVERSSGIRTVNRNWYYPLHVYTAVPMGNKLEDDIHKLLRFWHAIGGQSGRFLFNDYVDYKSTVNLADSITAIDMPLVLNDDSPPSALQMVKTYRDEDFLFTQQRLIQKPKQGTVLIAANGVTLGGGAYSVDYDSGLVTISGGIVDGVTYTWGGEFWVPAMFDSKPEFVVTNKRIQSTEFTVREVRLTDEDF